MVLTATAKNGKKSFEESEAKLQSVKQPPINLLKLLCRKTKLDEIDELQGYSVVSNLKPQLAHYHNLFLTMLETCQDMHRNVFYFAYLLLFAKTTVVGNDSRYTSRLKLVRLWHINNNTTRQLGLNEL